MSDEPAPTPSPMPTASSSPTPVAAPASQFAALAALIRSRPPSCGPVRLVAVDGHAGSGKTTFAAGLSLALAEPGDAMPPAAGSPGGAPHGAPVVHLDDLATHEEMFGWIERLQDEVVTPLSHGRTARHRVYDWTTRRFGSVREIPPTPVVLIEGVGAARRAVRPWLALSIWMDLPASAARARGEARDGPALTGFWRSWAAAEEAHFAADPSRPHVDVLATGSAGSPQGTYTIRTVTEGNRSSRGPVA